MSKAFDTISHRILLDKLDIFGIRGPARKWFESYLSHRQQYVVYDSAESSHKHITIGVPQGSIIGPILFLMYINDIVCSTSHLQFLLFADDTNIFLQGNDLNALCDTLNRELVHVFNWIKCNQLTLNHTKTQYLISHSSQLPSQHIDIKIDNLAITEVNEAKFLGVTIDHRLLWKSHIATVRLKISKIIGIMYKIRSCLNESNLRQIYLSLAYPHLLYCCAIWGGAHKSYLNTLVIAQKKLVRIMTQNPYRQHTSPIFKQLSLLKMQDILYQQTGLFVYKSIHELHPVDTGYQVISHTIATRGANETLRIPQCRTSHAQQNVVVRGSRIWNSLSNSTRHCTSIRSFKHKLASACLDQY